MEGSTAKKSPAEVNIYDFKGIFGRVSPYGVYDTVQNRGWVNVGISCDTAEFAVNSIRGWWHEMGKIRYPNAKKIYITADCGGSNSYRTGLWKTELQKLSAELSVEIHAGHFPPGTGKWNKIEHRMFSFVSQNRRGKPPADYLTIISLISSTETNNGLKIKAILDKTVYEKGIKISDGEFNSLNIYKYKFHGEWNYKIFPK